MKKVITEDQLSTSEVWRFEDVLLVAHENDESGVEVFHARKLAKLYGVNAEAETLQAKQLLVVVDNPDDPETIKRIRVASAEAWSKAMILLGHDDVVFAHLLGPDDLSG